MLLPFSAIDTKFNAPAQTSRLSKCITSFPLLPNAGIADAQRNTVLAAACSNKRSVQYVAQ